MTLSAICIYYFMEQPPDAGRVRRPGGPNGGAVARKPRPKTAEARASRCGGGQDPCQRSFRHGASDAGGGPKPMPKILPAWGLRHLAAKTHAEGLSGMGPPTLGGPEPVPKAFPAWGPSMPGSQNPCRLPFRHGPSDAGQPKPMPKAFPACPDIINYEIENAEDGLGRTATRGPWPCTSRWCGNPSNRSERMPRWRRYPAVGPGRKGPAADERD